MWYVVGEIALLLVLALLLGLLVGWLLWGRKRHDDMSRVQPRPVTRSREQTVAPRPNAAGESQSDAGRRQMFQPPERPRATAAPVSDATGEDATVVILRGDGGLSAAPAVNDDPVDYEPADYEPADYEPADDITIDEPAIEEPAIGEPANDDAPDDEPA